MVINRAWLESMSNLDVQNVYPFLKINIKIFVASHCLFNGIPSLSLDERKQLWTQTFSPFDDHMERVWALKISKTRHILCCKIFPSLHSMALSAPFSASPASGEGAPEPQKRKRKSFGSRSSKKFWRRPSIQHTHSSLLLTCWLRQSEGVRPPGRLAGQGAALTVKAS